MKTINRFKTIFLILITALLFSCAARSGSASDTTGANGATNGSGKVPKGNAHNVNN